MTDDAALLERLEASLAAAAEAAGEALPGDTAEALAAIQAREAQAWVHLGAFVAWVEEGADALGRLWDALGDADSCGLVEVLRLITNRETGLAGALAMLSREIQTTLGDREGWGPILDDDGAAVATVEQHASSTKWNVEAAWPDLAAAIEKADRQVVSREDGELESDTARALRIIQGVAGVGYLKVEALKALGLDPEDYRSKGPKRWEVKLL